MDCIHKPFNGRFAAGQPGDKFIKQASDARWEGISRGGGDA